MKISEWSETDRPRERLIQQGAEVLSDAELLAIFLRVGVPGKDAVSFAREILQHFGGINGLLSCDYRDFVEYPGLGPAKFAQLAGVLELNKRHMLPRLQENNVINNPESTRQYLRAWLKDEPSEIFACLFLDNRHRVIAKEHLFKGTIDGATVYPREVVRRCIAHNAAAVIFAHNHPSGIAEPSRADQRITQKLKQALALIDIRMLDHLIVGEDKVLSLAELGMV